MSYMTTYHRGIQIRYDYNIVTDGYTANFVLPEKQTMRVAFQRSVALNPPAGLNPGKNHKDGDTESEALERARAAIDSYLDGE
jgi:hypothetical protein